MVTRVPLTPTAGFPVACTAVVTRGTAPFTYTWAWGDGSFGSGATAGHRYPTPGPFTVTLVVTDTCGRAAVEHALRVLPPRVIYLSRNLTWLPQVSVLQTPPALRRWGSQDDKSVGRGKIEHQFARLQTCILP